jgi:hypothetical protein
VRQSTRTARAMRPTRLAPRPGYAVCVALSTPRLGPCRPPAAAASPGPTAKDEAASAPDPQRQAQQPAFLSDLISFEVGEMSAGVDHHVLMTPCWLAGVGRRPGRRLPQRSTPSPSTPSACAPSPPTIHPQNENATVPGRRARPSAIQPGRPDRPGGALICLREDKLASLSPFAPSSHIVLPTKHFPSPP